MKIVSWNTNGIRATVKNGFWQEFLSAVKPDVICLQEVKADPDQIPEEVLNSGYSSFFSPSTTKKGYSGVSLHSREEPLSVLYGLGVKEFDEEGRLIAAEYSDFWVVNTYIPNGGRPGRLEYKMRYYDAFLAFCEHLREKKPVIFCGDLNVAHEDIDVAKPEEWSSITGFLPEERAWLDEAINIGYVDIWRQMNPNRKETYSYWDNFRNARAQNKGWRIDYFFVSSEISTRVKKAEIHTAVFGSDHCPISISI
ncbi:exodeoxyribonuclease III [Patescibacteria group bacterium]|nr:exodeoxyribonuclease III [Patescibacteria group bacterium]MBU1754794.1 exodeoxyribonuclease III [Patescibacteria group bacterium]